MISASILNRKITFEKETTSKNSIGTPTETYVSLKNKYANVYVTGGSTEFGESGNLPNTFIDFTTRYDTDIDYKCRIKYNNQYYRILHIEELGRKLALRIRTIVWEEDT
jgi:SPP1 family predicted phage head-tail adaptor